MFPSKLEYMTGRQFFFQRQNILFIFCHNHRPDDSIFICTASEKCTFQFLQGTQCIA